MNVKTKNAVMVLAKDLPPKHNARIAGNVAYIGAGIEIDLPEKVAKGLISDGAVKKVDSGK